MEILLGLLIFIGISFLVRPIVLMVILICEEFKDDLEEIYEDWKEKKRERTRCVNCKFLAEKHRKRR